MAACLRLDAVSAATEVPARRLARYALGLVSVGAIVWGIAQMTGYAAARYGSVTPDGATYVAAVTRWLGGGSPYAAFQHAPYFLTDASWGAGFVYPPTALPVVSLFGMFGVDPWRFANLAALCVGALLIVRLERGELRVVSGLVALAYIAINPFVWSAFANAQITPLLVALMAVGYVYPRAAGPLGALGFLVKLYPGAMLVWAYRDRRWKGVRDGLLVGIAVVLATWPFVGSLWGEFVQVARNGLPSCDVGFPDSIRCVVGEPYGQLVAAVLGGSLVLSALVIGDRRVAFACLMFGVMLTSPDLNSAYWLLPSIGILPALAKFTPGHRQ